VARTTSGKRSEGCDGGVFAPKKEHANISIVIDALAARRARDLRTKAVTYYPAPEMTKHAASHQRSAA